MNEDFSATQDYPFDTDRLKKGDVILPATIESAFNVRRTAKRYNLAALKAADHIRQQFADRGEIVTVKIHQDALYILTDEEAVGYNRAAVRRGMRKMQQAHHRQLGSDRSLMTASTRTLHDRDVEVTGRVLSAMHGELRRQPVAVPTLRGTPLPPGVRAYSNEEE